MANKIVEPLKQILASNFALYLKTLNFHWNVTGVHFAMLHKFFEEQYITLSEEIDEIAERIRMCESRAPASFKEFSKLSIITDAKSKEAKDMLVELNKDHQEFCKLIKKVISIGEKDKDSSTVDLLTKILDKHEKFVWMIHSHFSSI